MPVLLLVMMAAAVVVFIKVVVTKAPPRPAMLTASVAAAMAKKVKSFIKTSSYRGDPFLATLGFQRLSTDVMRGMGVEPWRKFTGVPVISLVLRHLP